MPTLQKIDIHEGSSETVIGGKVMEVVRLARVIGLAGVSYEQLHSALSTPGLPALWAAHPLLGNLRLVERSPAGSGPFDATVSLRYVNITKVERGGSAIEITQTNKDKDGNTVKVPPPVGRGDPVEDSQTAVVKVANPLQTLIIERIEPDRDKVQRGIKPVEVSSQYTGKINSKIFRGGAPRTWLMENISYNNDGLGDIAWNMAYELRWRSNGWDQEAAWVDPETGKPGLGSDGESSEVIVQNQKEIDFGVLDL